MQPGDHVLDKEDKTLLGDTLSETILTKQQVVEKNQLSKP
jgi:hypothetical protein